MNKQTNSVYIRSTWNMQSAHAALSYLIAALSIFRLSSSTTRPYLSLSSCWLKIFSAFDLFHKHCESDDTQSSSVWPSQPHMKRCIETQIVLE